MKKNRQNHEHFAFFFKHGNKESRLIYFQSKNNVKESKVNKSYKKSKARTA